MRIDKCLGCKLGDHSRHNEVVKSAPEGVLGGVRCFCKGECQGKPDRRFALPKPPSRA